MTKYFSQNCECLKPVESSYFFVENVAHLFEILNDGIWCEETCAPRLRKQWSEENRTAGQCSVTAFLAQDIFGGKVYGIPLEDGNFHCYNIVGNSIFDLTCAQFKDQLLNYADGIEQDRNVHFMKQEKYERYLLLKEKLKMSGNQ